MDNRCLQIAIFIKQIAFASMDAGVSKETIDQVVPAAVGKSWELASKLLLDPMEGMKLAVSYSILRIMALSFTGCFLELPEFEKSVIVVRYEGK